MSFRSKVALFVSFVTVVTLSVALSFREDLTLIPASHPEVASSDFFRPASENIRVARHHIEESRFDEANSVLEQLQEDPLDEVRTQAVCSQAEVAIRTGRYEEAEGRLGTCQQEVTTFTGYDELTAYSHHLLGYLAHVKGSYNEAISEYEKALQIATVASGPASAAFLNTLNNLGNVHYRGGRYDLSEDIHGEVLDGRIALLGEHHPKVAASLGNLGNVHEAKGEQNRALQFHLQALEIWTTTLGVNNLQTAYTHDNIGQSLHKLGRHQEALDHLATSLRIKYELIGPHSPQVARTLLHLSLAKTELGKLVEAIDDASRGLSILENLKLFDIPKFSFLVEALSRAIHASNDLERARLLVSNELHRIQGKRTPAEIALRNAEARICSSLNDFRCVLKSAQTAIDLNTQVAGSGAQESFSLLESAISIDRLTESLFLKARALIELAKETESHSLRLRAFNSLDIALSISRSSSSPNRGNGAHTGSIKHSTSNLEDFIRTGLSLYQESSDQYLASRMFATIDVSNGGLLLQSLRQKEASLSDRRSVIGGIRTTHLFSQFDTITPLELDRSHSLVVFFELDEALYSATVSAKGYLFSKHGDLSEVAPLASSFISATSTRNLSKVVEQGFQLYQLLFSELETQLDGSKLVVVPSSSLKGLSFESLLTKNVSLQDLQRTDITVPYLLRRFHISYAYSASLLEVQHENKVSSFSDNLFALAPVFDTKDSYSAELLHFLRQVNANGRTTRLVSLPGSAQEVVQIGKILKSGSSLSDVFNSKANQILLREESSEHRLKTTDLKQFRYIHFATHSFIHPNDPDSSGIILNPNERTGEDGILYASEILDLELSAELVVLSSCDTAADANTDSFELSGFAKGFIFAGAQNLIASMWPADDVGTQILMQRMYGHIADGHSPDQALRKAKLDLLEMGGPIANPYFWAGFIHIGAPEGMVRPAA